MKIQLWSQLDIGEYLAIMFLSQFIYLPEYFSSKDCLVPRLGLQHMLLLGLSQIIYAQKFAQNAYRNFPKNSLIMLLSVPIMLALCS